MQLKKFLLFGLMAAVLPALAEEAADRKTATSLKYVTHELDTRQNKFSAEQNKAMEYTDLAGMVQKRAVTSDLDNGGTDSLPMVGGVNTKLATKQDDIAPINDHTAVTYTGQSGGIGQKGIYQTNESYVEQSNNLIDAKTFNAALKNGLESEFICSEYKPGTDLCWVYSIHNTGDNGLPSGYTELEWIESNGTQYIDTGVTPAQITKMDAKAQFARTDIRQALLSANSNGSSPWDTFAGINPPNSLDKFFVQWGSGMIPRDRWLVSTDTNVHKFVFDKSARTFTIDNVSISMTDYTMSETTSNMYMFAMHSGSLVDRLAHAKIYYMKLYNNDALVRNFIPARQNSDNKVGMYDTVSGEFFPSIPTNTNFAAGPEKDIPYTTLVPAGYTPVEFIESNGTQYIDTDIKGHMNYTYELDFQQKDTNNYRNWGVFNQSTWQGQNMSFTWSSGWAVRWASAINGTNIVDLGRIDTKRHILRIVDGEIYFDGVDRGRSTGHDSSFVFNYNLFLGTINPGGTTPSGNAKSKYYSYRVWDANGNLIQNFVPARQDSDNKVGMYDTVSGRFFPSVPANTNFAAGPDISNIVYVPQNQ